MKFYLSASKLLLCLLIFLYSTMLIAVASCSVAVLFQIILVAILLLFGWHAISKYALLTSKHAIRRICCQEETWCFSSNCGIYTAGNLSSSSYVSKTLVILMIRPRHKVAQTFVLIAADSLPHLQFRRLSMKLGY